MFTVKSISNFITMISNILNLKGAQQLSKDEQVSITGGMLSVSRGCPNGDAICCGRNGCGSPCGGFHVGTNPDGSPQCACI